MVKLKVWFLRNQALAVREDSECGTAMEGLAPVRLPSLKPFREISDYRQQGLHGLYFRLARFELHQENAGLHLVELGLLGDTLIPDDTCIRLRLAYPRRMV